MKKLTLLLVACATAIGAFAQKDVLGTGAGSRADDDWVGVGTGAYQPGILDYYSDEYSELMPAAVYESASTPGVYRFVPTPPVQGAKVVYDIVVHTENPEKVWCEDATFFHGIMNFNTRHKVKEAGGADIPANYGRLDDGAITFPTKASFQVMEMFGYKDSNLGGNFALYLPGKSPADDPIMYDNWEVMGKGKYVEGLLDCEYKAGVAWDVEIERSLDTPGCYRLKPYPAGNPSCPGLPEVADTYLYIHAEDEMEVYTTDFLILNKEGHGYKLQHRAVGKDADPSYFGTLEDGVITFPAQSHYASIVGIAGAGGTMSNLSGKACIVLPGYKYYDYFVECAHPTCAKSAGDGFCNFPITLTGGADVASAVLVVEAGAKTPADVDLQSYIDGGNTAFPSMFFGFQLNLNFPLAADQFNTNRWTMITIAVDSRNKAKGAHFSTFFTPEMDKDWEDYAKGRYTDVLLGESYMGENHSYEVTIQKRKGSTGRLRVVDPYKTHPVIMGSSYLAACADHPHYLYINADDPECVYIEESAMGADFGYGDVVASSAIGSLLNQGNTLEQAKAQGAPAGRRVGDDFIFPARSLFFFETNYRDGMLQGGSEGTLLHITEYVSGIEDVIVDGDSLMPVEYYDLQGRRLDTPSAGQPVLRRQGNTVSKIVNRH